MSWLAILQLSLTLLTQALAAFAGGAKKEHEATVVLEPHHAQVVQCLGQQCP